MKKVCGTCLFQIGAEVKPNKSGIYVYCAYDNEWRRDSTKGCSNWKKKIAGLSKKNKIDLANQSTNKEGAEKRHLEVMQNTKENRKYQLKLLLLGFVLGIIGTLVSQYILSLWMK